MAGFKFDWDGSEDLGLSEGPAKFLITSYEDLVDKGFFTFKCTDGHGGEGEVRFYVTSNPKAKFMLIQFGKSLGVRLHGSYEWQSLVGLSGTCELHHKANDSPNAKVKYFVNVKSFSPLPEGQSEPKKAVDNSHLDEEIPF